MRISVCCSFTRKAKPLDEAMLRTTYERLATLYRATADSAAVGALAGRCREQFPDDPRATIWAASALLLQNKLDGAREVLERLIRQLEASDGTRPEYVEA